MLNRFPRPFYSLLSLCIAAYILFFSLQLLLHYYSFGSRALDLGNHGQAIWNTAQGRWFHQTNQPGATNRLSLHVEPILVPISWLYYLYPGPEILFIFQATVVALGAIPVFALARWKLHNEGLAFVFALAYLLFPAIQGATLLDFHAITLAPPFLLAAFYFLETERPKGFALFAVLAVACKEDMTLLALMMGLYAFAIRRRYRLGLITMGLALAWAFLAVFVIPPVFAGTENIHWGRYDHLGQSPTEIVWNMIRWPQLFLDHLTAVGALTYFRLLLAPTAYLALLNPVTLLLALPSLGINLLSNFPPMQEVNSLIYAAPIVPAVIISSIYGAGHLQRLLLQASQGLGIPTSSTLTNLGVGGLVLAASLIYQAAHGFLPGGGQFRGWEEVTDHHRRAGQIFAQIPPEAALSAQDRLNPHVSGRETLYIFDRVDEADHILLDVTEDSWPLHPVALRHRVDQFLEDDFGIVAAEDGYLLLARNRTALPRELPEAFFSFARVPQPQTFKAPFPVEVIFAGKLRLLGYSLHLGAHEKVLPYVTLYWQALEPLEEDYLIWPFFIDRNGQVIEAPTERPIVTTLWYPTSRWKQSEIIKTSTLPWELAPEVGDEFTLAVGVAREAWNNRDKRLSVTQAGAGLYLYENKSWARLGSFQRVGRKAYQPLEAEALPLPQQPRQVQFWNLIELKGVQLPLTELRAGDTLPFTLHWQSREPITVDLTTFAHLLDTGGQVVAQLDWTPQDPLGYLPTSAWLPGRPVVDRQQLQLPETLIPGSYRLVAGWYYAPTNERLPITGSDSLDGKGEGEVVEVGRVIIR
jgi:uncharacterized membrane protein